MGLWALLFLFAGEGVLFACGDTFLTFVPSEAGGATGIAVQVTAPERCRYLNGCPVVVNVPGGWGGVGIGGTGVDLCQEGFVQIRFNFPGSGEGETKSGGSYDTRGPNCLEALKDVVLFALGQKTDSQGKYLKDLVSLPLLETNVGVVAYSNGGNAAISVLGLYGDELSSVAWLLNWESPVGDGMPDVEAGGWHSETNPTVNPAYNPNDGSWDLSSLRYDANLLLYYTDSENPTGGRLSGGLYFDINGNGAVDYGTDYVLFPIVVAETTGIHAYYSERVTSYAWSHGVYPSSIPSHITTVGQTREFWRYRNGELWFSAVAKALPNLKFMVLASEKDHVQAAPDHPHILVQYHGFLEAGLPFVRLNPDSSYLRREMDSLPAGMVDNDAGAEIDHFSIRRAVEPEAVPFPALVSGGILELADRTVTDRDNRQISLFAANEDESLSLQFKAKDRVLVLCPRIAKGYEMYAAVLLDESTLFVLTGMDTGYIFSDGLLPYNGDPVMLDFGLDPEFSGTFVLYTYFVPEGSDPFNPPAGTAKLGVTYLNLGE